MVHALTNVLSSLDCSLATNLGFRLLKHFAHKSQSQSKMEKLNLTIINNPYKVAESYVIYSLVMPMSLSYDK